jgi:DNA-binding NarL/FixJ family response regulator
MVGSVVLAEDSLEQCFFFERAFKEVAPQAVFAAVNDGDKLITLLESYLPDLLFLDLNLPCKNGVECIKEIREQRPYDSMSIIVFTVSADDQAIQSVFGYGANMYMVKPGEYFLLKSLLNNILSMDWSDPQSITANFFCDNKYVPYNSNDLRFRA